MKARRREYSITAGEMGGKRKRRNKKNVYFYGGIHKQDGAWDPGQESYAIPSGAIVQEVAVSERRMFWLLDAPQYVRIPTCRSRILGEVTTRQTAARDGVRKE